jgi:CRP/FNR family transcriptional regulator, cyclic AMP receptor protein
MTDDDFDFTQPADKKPGAAPAASPPQPSAPFKPATSKFYDAAVAERFFRAAGKPEKLPAGTTLFMEGEKSGKQGLFGKRVIHRMYYLTQGEVALTANGKPLDAIRSGEVFGEMAVISEIPGATTPSARSATATAKTDCDGFSLDGTETQAGLKQTPEFALMLMSVMFDRMRFVAARLAMRKVSKSAGVAEAMPSFTSEMLTVLEDKLERATVLQFEPGRGLMREGDVGTSMYVILSGQVEVSIKGSVVEIASVGATIGEMALVDQSPRAASATAKTSCKLLAVNRSALLNLVKLEPAIGMALMRSMAERLRNMNALLQ